MTSIVFSSIGKGSQACAAKMYQMVNFVNGGRIGVEREQRPKNQRGAHALAAKLYGQGCSADELGPAEPFKSEKICAVIAHF
jgi:hypothetical protein